jgi:hypothetical protein
MTLKNVDTNKLVIANIRTSTAQCNAVIRNPVGIVEILRA